MPDHIVVYITASSQEEAAKLSRGLVESKLAYCVNAVPGIVSTYFWEGKIHSDPEFLLIAKSRADRFAALEAWVRKNHSYSVPEVIALPVTDGSRPYLKAVDDWLLSS